MLAQTKLKKILQLKESFTKNIKNQNDISGMTKDSLINWLAGYYNQTKENIIEAEFYLRNIDKYTLDSNFTNPDCLGYKAFKFFLKNKFMFF